ncbi:hypothetical protein P691DRAFT_700256 [Macrolepiota fuliginosa MF-IS2]|uniref:Uncharacterized protein n=1 Tax=Macrolepiota fuliginosa MF-IS2 TaxID=1400762 RepID=A0A9P5XIG9_9AGAR|nr:hypothetical protein P691DRAFT_700256 [Macrolepiota fuliginosa MF-IS2]
MRIWFRVLAWKERSYKLAMRRRHGIPDNDHRPFNVAYAAVVRARQEKEAVRKAKAMAAQAVPPHDRRNAQTEQTVRQRFGIQTTAEAPRASSYGARFPGAYFTEGTPARSHPESSVPPNTTTNTSRYASQAQQTIAPRRYENEGPSYLNGTRRSSRKGLDIRENSGSQKRGFIEDPADEQEVTKRSKKESGSIGNEADDTTWQDQVLLQRGAKRYLFDDDEEGEEYLIERQPRDKRARKVSLEKGIQAQGEDSEMDVDEEEDEVDDLPYIQRGKKRDRAEAGSTFGGDDDESSSEPDNSDPKAKGRRRKRRTVAKRKSDVAITTRGQKRDRDLEREETEIESGNESSYVSRKKRGKKALQDDEASEHSTTRSQTSSGSRNRKIGEEWNSNGIRWKLGPNGQRLRQALVKKARQKFPMPEDSQHPDREVDFEVYVEAWLSEEEYRDAKARHVLAGQDTPKRLDSQLTVDLQAHINGKNLLWSSTSTPVDSPVSYSPVSERAPTNQRIARTSLSSFGSPRTNPFDQIPTHNVRRISSITRAASVGSPSLADSTNSSPHSRFKTYSKLEKQELEAQALMRLRELKSKKEAEAKEAQAAKEKENLDKTQGAAAFSTIPTITVTAPTEASKSATQPSSLFSQPKPAEDTSKPTGASKPPPLFGFGPTSTAIKPSADAIKPIDAPKLTSFGPTTTPFPSVTPTPALKADTKPTAPASNGPSLPFTLGAPSAAPSTAQTAQPGSNLFGPSAPKPPTSGTDSGAGASRISFNPPTTTTAPQSTATANPTFSFGFKPAAEQKTPEITAASQSAGSGGSSLLSRLDPPMDSTIAAPTPSSSQPSSFNFAKPSANTTAPNPFSAPTSQPTTTQATSSTTSTTAATQPKFNFGFSAAPANTSTANTSTIANTSAANPFESVVKGPYQLMVSFTPLTPDGGVKPAMLNSGRSAPESSSFGFKAAAPPTLNANDSNASKNTAIPAFGTSSGTSKPFGMNASGSNMNSVFGSTTFGAKPAENKPTEVNGSSSQPTKPLFSFGMTGGQPSSANLASGSQSGGSVFGSGNATTAKPTSTSSSLFGALGPQTTSAFGSTPAPGAGKSAAPTSVFGSSNASAAPTSAPTGIFGQQPSSLNQAASNSQPPNIFGSAGAGAPSVFGATVNKPAEATKSPFTLTPVTNGTSSTTTTAASEAQKPSFQFKLPGPANNANASSNNPSGLQSTSAPSSGSTFTFNFANPNKSNTNQPSMFGGPASGSQSVFATKPSTFGTGSVFGGASGSGSAFNPLGAASQSNPTEQK